VRFVQRTADGKREREGSGRPQRVCSSAAPLLDALSALCMRHERPRFNAGRLASRPTSLFESQPSLAAAW
jgi:hypothetical protein